MGRFHVTLKGGIAIAGLVLVVLAAACEGGGGGSAGPGGGSVFSCGNAGVVCRSNLEYCHSVTTGLPDGGFDSNPKCFPNPCSGTMDCDCITDDAETREPECKSGGCDLRNTGGVIEWARVSCRK